MLQVANRSVSVPMTLSDTEGRCVRDPFSRRIHTLV